jgi:hypothetical protein
LRKQFICKKPISTPQFTIQFKGKILLSLTQYPRLKIRSVIWRWYFHSTGSGANLFQRGVNNFVLYTRIQKANCIYRLIRTVRKRNRSVHPKIKRMTIMIYLYTRSFLEKAKKTAYEALRTYRKEKETEGKMII